jgi:hypothetical protein
VVRIATVAADLVGGLGRVVGTADGAVVAADVIDDDALELLEH